MVRRTSTGSNSSKRSDRKTKKADKIKKAQAKQAAKTKARTDAVFGRAMDRFKDHTMEGYRLEINKILDENPGWTKPLAELFHFGPLVSLLKKWIAQSNGEEAAADEMADERWKGKAKVMGELPPDVKMLMLEEIGLTDKLDDAAADKWFPLQFWTATEVLLPNVPNFRQLSVVCHVAKQRVKDLNFNAAEILKSRGQQGPPDALWTLEDGALSFVLSEEKHVLPSLPDDEEWQLSDANCPTCVVRSPTNSLFVFSCRSFFSEVKDVDPGKRWKMNFSEPAENASP